MTTDLITTEWFDHQKEARGLRFVQHEGITYVPILDLATATGMRKRSLLKVVSKHPVDFAQHIKRLHLETVRGLQETDCLDRDGAMLLMFKVSTNHIRNLETKVRIEEFKKWQINKMNQPLALPAPVPAAQDFPKILNEIKFAKDLSTVVGTDPLALYCQILDKHDLGYLGGLLVVQKEPVKPALPKPKEYLTCKDIGEIIGKSAHEVYMFLYQQKPPLVVKDYRKDEWRITDEGRKYGWEESREITGGYIVWRIKWKRDILRLFNVFDHLGGE